MEYWWGYLLLGLVTGIIGSMLGIGGGIVMVPLLVMLFSVSQKSAQGMSLAVMILLTMAATLRYMANPGVKINWSAVGLMGLTAIVGAIIGAEIARHAPVRVLQKIFALVMILAAIKLAFFSRPKTPEDTGISPPFETEETSSNLPGVPHSDDTSAR